MQKGPREAALDWEGSTVLRMIRGLDRRGGVVHWRVLGAAGLSGSVEFGLGLDGGRGSKRTDQLLSFPAAR